MACINVLFMFAVPVWGVTKASYTVTAIHNMGYGLIVCELTLINL
jgi:hypothetical protein